MMYVVKELWHGRSARDETRKEVGRGMWRSVNELMLVRYAEGYFGHFTISRTLKLPVCSF